jgi:hypothetical protein
MVRRGTRSGGKHLCGLYYNVPRYGILEKVYLHQVEINVHASILATTSRTVLQQTFANPSTARGIREVRYAFPLYEGVSVVGFSCLVGNRLIVGEVKEKEKAKQVYQEAVSRGETAGLFEQLPEASDVFTTTIGNIPPGSEVKVTITYLGELKHDMEVDGIRFTIPTSICPRYGDLQSSQANSLQMNGTISVVVDAEMAEGSFIQKLLSPSHPIALSMGTTSVHPNAEPSMNKASATLSLGVAHLETDFILQVVAKDTGVPKAMLETHPTIPNHRALMATLVPKFALPAEKPEVVFVCDQSGSMEGDRIALARSALRVFLRSLPVGVKFNICSFGSRHSFLFPRSVTYGQDTLDQATHYADELAANYGGTEMLSPLKATIENRYKDIPLEIIMLTDGETWNQQSVFNYLNEQIQDNKAPIRVFTLGIGSGVSHALIEGIAKAGNGFAQSVQDGEKMSSKVVRMLKGALSPHVNDYTLEVKYSGVEEDDEFEIVEKVADSLKVKLDIAGDEKATTSVSIFYSISRYRLTHTSSKRNRSRSSIHSQILVRMILRNRTKKIATPTFPLSRLRRSSKHHSLSPLCLHSPVQQCIFCSAQMHPAKLQLPLYCAVRALMALWSLRFRYKSSPHQARQYTNSQLKRQYLNSSKGEVGLRQHLTQMVSNLRRVSTGASVTWWSAKLYVWACNSRLVGNGARSSLLRRLLQKLLGRLRRRPKDGSSLKMSHQHSL